METSELSGACIFKPFHSLGIILFHIADPFKQIIPHLELSGRMPASGSYFIEPVSEFDILFHFLARFIDMASIVSALGIAFPGCLHIAQQSGI